MKSYARIFCVAIGLSLATTAPLATTYAEGPGKAEIAKAREDFRRAVALEEAGDFPGALAIFKEVALVKSSPQVRFHIAVCEEKTGDLVGALGSFKIALYEAQQTKGAGDVETLSKEGIAKLEPRIPQLTLQKGEGSAAAKLTLDGKEIAVSGAKADLSINPGPHVIEATADGHKPLKLEIMVAEGEKKTIELKLEVEAKPEPTATATAVVTAAPTATSTGDAPTGSSPLLPAGIAVGAAGVVSLGLAGLFFGLKQDAIAQLDAACGADKQSCPPELAETAQMGQTYDLLSTALFIGGLAVTAGGVAMVLFAPKGKSQTSVELLPGARFANAGATVRLRY